MNRAKIVGSGMQLYSACVVLVMKPSAYDVISISSKFIVGDRTDRVGVDVNVSTCS